jgi:neutral amino acid transport system permease protein
VDFGQAFTDGFRAALGIPAAAFALAAIGLNLQYGFTGILNFGQVGFLLVGAYGTAISADGGVPLWLAVLIGIASAVALGLLLGIPTLRLRTDYLAIVTISAAEILRISAGSRQLEGLTGGAFGIGGFANAFFDLNPISPGRYGVGDVSFDHRALWIMSVAWACVALASVLVWLVARSPYGRVLRSIREDEDAARSLGKNAFGMKLQSLVLGGALGAVGGIVIAIDAQFTNVDYWRSALTFFAYTVLIIGGVGSVLGPVIGSMLFWFLYQAFDTVLRQAITEGAFGDTLTPTDTGPIRIALVGLALMLLMVFRPQGMFGNRAESMVDD